MARPDHENPSDVTPELMNMLVVTIPLAAALFAPARPASPVIPKYENPYDRTSAVPIAFVAINARASATNVTSVPAASPAPVDATRHAVRDFLRVGVGLIVG